jgi:hypothetical protein
MIFSENKVDYISQNLVTYISLFQIVLIIFFILKIILTKIKLTNLLNFIYIFLSIISLLYIRIKLSYLTCGDFRYIYPIIIPLIISILAKQHRLKISNHHQ